MMKLSLGVKITLKIWNYSQDFLNLGSIIMPFSTKRKVGQKSVTSGELLPELKHVKHLALESTSTGIFARQSQEMEFTLSSLNIL
jgi:hypothetical protein